MHSYEQKTDIFALQSTLCWSTQHTNGATPGTTTLLQQWNQQPLGRLSCHRVRGQLTSPHPAPAQPFIYSMYVTILHKFNNGNRFSPRSLCLLFASFHRSPHLHTFDCCSTPTITNAYVISGANNVHLYTVANIQYTRWWGCVHYIIDVDCRSTYITNACFTLRAQPTPDSQCG